ncbi:hypothetical protein ACFQ3S_08550 [Mucilaginibacter terrae]|uniref:hypothetical protein n=1 Tax=Mucilaginibacter terrae TaxID=1955052 RepID=UPI00363DC44B
MKTSTPAQWELAKTLKETQMFNKYKKQNFMKIIRNIAAMAIIVAALTACGSSENKSIGGSTDTSKSASGQGVSSVGGVDSTAKDTTETDTASQGNSTPTGRP